MEKGHPERGKKILHIFFVTLTVVIILSCIMDFAEQGFPSAIISVVSGILQIYIAYLLKTRHNWAIWVFMILGVSHLIFLFIRMIGRPLYIYLIIVDIFYVVSAIVLNIFIKDIRCYLSGEEQNTLSCAARPSEGRVQKRRLGVNKISLLFFSAVCKRA